MTRSATAARASLSEALTGPGAEASLIVTVLTSGFAVRLAANVTGAVKTSALARPASTRAAVVPKLVWPAAPVTTPQLDVPLATHVAFADR
jgi:hypothetical protein